MPEDSVEVSIGENDAVDPDDAEAGSLEAADAGKNEDKDDSGDELWAGKFKSVDELEKGYLEAQKVISGDEDSGDDDEAEDVGDGKIDLSDDDDDEDAGSETAPVNLDSVVEEYSENGEISEDTYASLEKAGMSRNHVDSFIRGQEALGNQLVTELSDTVGGKDEMGKLLKWAKGNLADEQKQAYNDALDSGNTAAAKMLLQGMQAQRRAKIGSDPNLVTGENTPDLSGVKPFRSTDAIANAMDDERYEKDPAYREKVDRRVGASDVL